MLLDYLPLFFSKSSFKYTYISRRYLTYINILFENYDKSFENNNYSDYPKVISNRLKFDGYEKVT